MSTTKVDVTGAVAKLKLSQRIVLEEAKVMLQQATDLGVKTAQEKLRTSTTRHGRWRMSRGIGRGPGREDTGRMIDSVTGYDWVGDDSHVSVRFGWGPGKSRKYFEWQDKGTGRIPAANAMWTAERMILNELPRLKRNMLQRIRRRTAGGK